MVVLQEVVLLKMGELTLKGLNRSRFEERLIRDVQRRLSPLGTFSVSSRQSVIVVRPQDQAEAADAFAVCSRVFGIAALTRAVETTKDMPAIISAAIQYLRPEMIAAKTFKAEAKRSDKTFPLTSPQIAREAGRALHQVFSHLSVDVKNPDVTVFVEIRDTSAFVHTDAKLGAGGLPPRSAGRAMLLLSGGIDSPVAGFMMARRGLEVLPLHFHSYPYTSEQALDKVARIAQILGSWTGSHMMYIVSLTAIQESIRRQCPAGYSTLIARRFMMDIAGRLAARMKAGAVITGESLGQVASQTMEALAVTEQAAACSVLRPLVGLDKEEIVKKAREIGTFETSILPYEDCCTVFTPRHPKTQPRLTAVLEAEAPLDREDLIEKAIAGMEKRVV